MFESGEVNDVLNGSTGRLNDGTPDEVDVVVWPKVLAAECGDKPGALLWWEGAGVDGAIWNGDRCISSHDSIFLGCILAVVGDIEIEIEIKCCSGTGRA